MKTEQAEKLEYVVFFDGVCNLCNSSIDFLIRIDKKNKLKYSSLQSEYAKKRLNTDIKDFGDSVVFLSGDNVYYRSEAALKILKTLGGPYKLIALLLSIFPYFILNYFYRLIAKNRYKWFGKRDTCRLPTEEEKDLFI
jgi:predicted DCC family thiol-disulfide oxidoreductase YuxK